jgi:hypothetical protein
LISKLPIKKQGDNLKLLRALRGWGAGKMSPPLPLFKTFPPSPLLAKSISPDSTFNAGFLTVILGTFSLLTVNFQLLN